MQIRFYNRPIVPSPLDLFCNAVFKAWKNIQQNWRKPKIKIRLYPWILCYDQDKGRSRSTKSCTLNDERNKEYQQDSMLFMFVLKNWVWSQLSWSHVPWMTKERRSLDKISCWSRAIELGSTKFEQMHFEWQKKERRKQQQLAWTSFERQEQTFGAMAFGIRCWLGKRGAACRSCLSENMFVYQWWVPFKMNESKTNQEVKPQL